MRLFLDQRLHEHGSLAQRLLWIHFNGQLHSPADCSEQHHLAGGFIRGYQPSGEALVPLDGAEERRAAGGAHGDAPGYTWTEVIVHTDGEFGAFLSRAHERVHFGGAAVPGIMYAVTIADRPDVPAV